jgi:hypothetical protein
MFITLLNMMCLRFKCMDLILHCLQDACSGW